MAPKLNYPRILGGSANWLKQRDEEIAEAKRVADLDEDANLREIIRKLTAENQRLTEENANLRAQQRQSSKSVAKKADSKKPGARPHSPGKMKIDGVECVSVRHIHEQTGLHQSVISRRLAKIKPKISGTTYYYPASQVSDIKRKKPARR
jgi:hypothetical protein